MDKMITTNDPPSMMTEWSSEDHESSIPSSQCNPLDEPSPLGLRLNKTQSLLELIEKRLSEENNASLTVKSSKNLNSPTQKDARRTTTLGANDKLKASNFPASLLRIGNWQLARPPIFFKETNPQPRKCTIWKPTSDFTGGEASKNRIRGHELDQVVATQGYSPSSFQDVELATTTQSPPLTSGQNPNPVTARHVPEETLSSSSVMAIGAIERNATCEGHGYLQQRSWEQLKVPDLHPSMSMGDQENHIGSSILQQVTTGFVPSDKTPEFWHVMENIKQDLLSDTQSTTFLDEKSLLKKVNSLSSLFQDPTTSSSEKVEK
ncbi:Hypothetical predicted protein [Olea europaea subsp. europaea]|uniref:TRF2/HOY1 PH-like domain-containing protein n=1 Tax=Olea europaea subsp. europaea TaxID=158383 RepID=A0A8S0Q6Z8_OLEEU|nr:Hypothetical predicted protein [Olea europaea subsp. europaea]